MTTHCLCVALALALSACPTRAADTAAAPPKAFRPPSVPLVTHDPYFSVWSPSDKLTDSWPNHWTGAINGMCGLARIDGKVYRWMGPPNLLNAQLPAMTQTALDVRPTQTIYSFEANGVRLDVTFFSPLIASDLELVSRPVSYVRWHAAAADGKAHQVTVYLDVTAEWAVNKSDQKVVASRVESSDLAVMRAGTAEQPVLAKQGDNLRIDWGHVYLAVPKAQGAQTAIGADVLTRGEFVAGRKLPIVADKEFPRPASERWPVLSLAQDLALGLNNEGSAYAMIGYDDVYSIEYMGKRLRAWWRRSSAAGAEPDASAADPTFSKLLSTAAAELPALTRRAAAFDAELTGDLRDVGGDRYAQLAVLAYRQCLAAHKLVDDGHGTPLYFSKENFSNGCIDTVDVTYPSSPFFLLLNPTLLKGQLTPIMDYAASPRWRFDFAPHDLGTYPKANGQVYGDGERGLKNQMPVEECGNMLIMVAALAHLEGNAEYAQKYWPTLEKWANYLKANGLDPANQLCTDDFAGHLARNANLSLKAIVALGGYAQVCDLAHKGDEAKQWRETAKSMADQWQKLAADGDHYRLTYDAAGSWSQKYNLVWDKILKLNLFPPEVAAKEVAFYKQHQNEFGLPLDSRKAYTKLDWTVWTATLAPSRDDFEALVDPLNHWADATASRVPLTDWYDTKTGKQSGFQARSVVGGIYIPLLTDETIWKKWSGKTKAN